MSKKQSGTRQEENSAIMENGKRQSKNPMFSGIYFFSSTCLGAFSFLARRTML